MQVIPVSFTIMSAKTTTCYEAVLKYHKETLKLKGKKVMADWEEAARKAWRKCFRGVDVWGCIWHFQRVSKKIIYK